MDDDWGRIPSSLQLTGRERFRFACGESTVAEDEPGKEGEAGDAAASSMQPDAAWRSHRQVERHRKSESARTAAAWAILAAAAVLVCIPAGRAWADDGAASRPAGRPVPQAHGEPLRVALTGQYPPFSFYDKRGELAGFDVDVSRELARRIGRPLELVATDWPTILPGLLTGKYDAIVSSMAITPERAKQVNFSDPYYESGAQLFVRRDNPDEVYDISECNGLKIAANLGETYQRYLEVNHPEINVVTTKASSDIFELLSQRRVTGFVSDRLVGLYQIKSAGRPFVPVGLLLYKEKMGIPVRRDNPQLLADINAALGDMRNDGTLREIHEKYFGLGQTGKGASGHMPASVIAAKLAKGFAITLCIAAASILIGFFLAIPCGLILNHPRGGLAILYWPVRTIVDVLRGTPVYVQLIFAFFGLGIPMYVAAVGTLGINSMAYMAEVVRAGLMSVDRGQVRAGRALALNRWQVFRHVVWPQAFRVAIPPLMNSVVALIKDTALVAVISAPEVIRQAQSIISVNFQPWKYYLIVAIMFFVVTFPLMKLAGYMEGRIRQRGFAHD